MGWYQAYISLEPEIQGGYPVIRGTRTPVRTIVMFGQGSSGCRVSLIRETLPHLSDEQIRAALAYYDAEPGLVDEDIARQEAALSEYFSSV